MALYSQASDLKTHQTIWIGRNVVKNESQLNSHRDDAHGQALERAGIDGFSAAQIANFCSDCEHDDVMNVDDYERKEYYRNEWNEEKYDRQRY
jgi:hypothetical protein